MATLRFRGIPPSVATEVRRTMRAPGYGHPAHRELATGYGPCRQCLRTFRVGEEERILFTYQPFVDEGSLPAPGPVFIHAEDCADYDDAGLPADLRSLPLVLEAYADGGRLLMQERVDDRNAEELLTGMFSAGAAYAHVRNGEAGCFIARVDRRESP